MGRVLPILFNTEMVRAILDGRKTVTRRLVKKYKEPYEPGDILYVRETWAWEPCWDCGMDTEEHNCVGKISQRIYNHKNKEYGCYIYKASVDDNVYPSAGTWHPSIHMQMEAARIWLKVTDVRVERLQNMTGQDILREGVNCHVHPEADYFDGNQKMMFAELWDSTIKKTDLDHYGWDANPMVWAIAFERCEKPEEL